MFLQSSVLFLRTIFQVPNILFSWQRGGGKYNAPTATENLLRESVSNRSFSTNFGKIRADILCAPKKVPASARITTTNGRSRPDVWAAVEKWST